MPEKSNVLDEKLKHKGYFNYTDTYNFCYNWLKDQGYLVLEEDYTEKLTSFGKEIQITWTAKKKVSDYFANSISVKWHILGMNDAEVEINGKKEKTNKGEVKITVTADLVRDYERRWEDKPFWKMMRGVYDKYVIRTTIDLYEDRLQEKAEKFINDLKAFLMLEGRQ